MKAFLEEIMADHVHQEMTRNLILVYLRLFLLIVIKDVFLFLVSFLNKLKNLMDRTHPTKDIGTPKQEIKYNLLREFAVKSASCNYTFQNPT